jgi:hypothetical protein
MKVVVWPSLVGISICWSIIGGFFSLLGFSISLWAARLQGKQGMTR